MSLVKTSFQKLYPTKEFPFNAKLKNSKAFNGYNANIKLYNNILEARLSKKWFTISREIQMGLIQSLLIILTYCLTELLEHRRLGPLGARMESGYFFEG